jgi:hypothetical protein
MRSKGSQVRSWHVSNEGRKGKERKGRTNTASKMNERIYRLLQHGKALMASELRQKWRELRARISTRISTRSFYCILHGNVHRRGEACRRPSQHQSMRLRNRIPLLPHPPSPPHTIVGRKSCHVMSFLRVRMCSWHFPSHVPRPAESSPLLAKLSTPAG